jgi:preprotein translocase subunit YajC
MHSLPGTPFALLLLQSATGGSGIAPFLFQIAAFVAIFYFIIIRPQQKQRKQHEETLRAVKRGDRIVTTGGIIGEVVHVKETMVDGAPTRALDDEVTIRSGESRLIVERGRIAKVITAGGVTSTAAQG